MNYRSFNSLKVLSVAVTIIMLQANIANAIFDVKLGYGTLASKTNLTSFYSGASSDIPSAIPTAGLTLDARVTIPLVGLGIGLRTEDQKISYDNSALSITNSFKRTSLVLGYRLLDTLIYVGPVATIGMNHSNNIELKAAGTTLNKISSSSTSSTSLGLEAGAGLLGFNAGAEVGYMTMKYKDAKDSINNNKYDLDMSGSYIKVFVGFGI